MALYEKPVKLLFRDMVKDLSIQKGDAIKRENKFLVQDKLPPCQARLHFRSPPETINQCAQSNTLQC